MRALCGKEGREQSAGVLCVSVWLEQQDMHSLAIHGWGRERDSWKSEYCSEYNTIRFSEREKMCNSVLPPGDDRKLLEEHDKEPVDPGESSEVGQEQILTWTAQSVGERFGAIGWAREGAEVDPDFLKIQPLSVQEGEEMGFWRLTA